MSRIVYIDELHTLEAEFKDLDNLPVNVEEGIVVYIEKPNKDLLGPFSATRTDKGVYRYDYYPPDAGRYEYRFQNPLGTLIAEKHFNVKEPKFDTIPPFGPVTAVAETPIITYVAIDAIKLDATTITPSMTYVAVTPEVGPITATPTVPEITYEAQDAVGALQIQHGDVFFIQPSAPSGGSVGDEHIGHQKRVSYPNGDFDEDEINEILDYSGEPWTPAYLAVDSKNFKLVFGAQNRTSPEEWYVYTCNFDGSGLTKIFDVPIDATPGRFYEIRGLEVNNRDNAPAGDKVWVCYDGTFALTFRGFLVSMGIDGSSQTTRVSNGRNAEALTIAQSENKITLDVDDFGYNNYDLDPFAYDCDSHASTHPVNSAMGGRNGEDNFIYNFDAFATIRRAATSCSPTTPYNSWSSNAGSTTLWIAYSEYSDEVLASGTPANAIDKTTKAKREINNNGVQSGSSAVHYCRIFEPEYVT